MSRIAPGWWLPTLAAGGTAVGVKGATMLHAIAPARSFCHAWAGFNTAIGNLTTTAKPNCGSLDATYRLGLVLTIVGFGAAALAGIGLARRSRAAARSGSPWPLRRATHAVAEWLDARLPGTRGSKPRLRPGYITALGVVLAMVAVGVAESAVSSEQRAQQVHAYNAAQRTLAALELPSAIHRKPSTSCGSPVCGYSLLMPPQVEPMLARLLHATAFTSLARALPCPSVGLAGHCPIVLRGQVEGYPVVVDIFWHLVVVTHGRPPAGSIPLPLGHGHLFLLGSDVDASAVEPSQGD